jgi:cysteine-rich repeat protein
MFGPTFFWTYPQEFVASIANEWFASSSSTLQLGLDRFTAGYREPINQALFFAEVYSRGGPTTRFYGMDQSCHLSVEDVPVGRDTAGRINRITHGGRAYGFELDAAGNVTDFATCGDGTVSGGEECDDGNATSGDCCSAACSVETAPACSVPACSVIPTAGCRRPTSALQARIKIRDSLHPTSDSLQWTWKKGEATSLADFGDPLTTDGITLCGYDESGAQPVLTFQAKVPAGVACGGQPCWKAAGSTAFKFGDRTASFDGVAQAMLRSGPAGNAQLKFKCRGVSLSGRPLGMPSPPIGLPFRLQLQARGGACWESEFATATRNEQGRLDAKGQ